MVSFRPSAHHSGLSDHLSGSQYDALGLGWGNSVLALVIAVVGIPAPFLL